MRWHCAAHPVATGLEDWDESDLPWLLRLSAAAVRAFMHGRLQTIGANHTPIRLQSTHGATQTGSSIVAYPATAKTMRLSSERPSTLLGDLSSLLPATPSGSSCTRASSTPRFAGHGHGAVSLRPAAYCLTGIPSRLFYLGLIVSFAILYKKQEGGYPSA